MGVLANFRAYMKVVARTRYDRVPELLELLRMIAWENYRARFNRVFGVGPVGFSAGAACAIPEHAAG